MLVRVCTLSCVSLVQMHTCHSAHVEVRGLECQSLPSLLLKTGTLTISPVYTRSAGPLTSWISLFQLSMSPEFWDCRYVLPCLVSPGFHSSSQLYSQHLSHWAVSPALSSLYEEALGHSVILHLLLCLHIIDTALSIRIHQSCF